ncbi:MAG: hypothetical protein A2045_06440 [Rhodocyclales bacterium GWA2_65_20]|nr:MAG: hypothetical protein A2045_06440 [Rhodocyclales bacterium GWA2_65_20]
MPRLIHALVACLWALSVCAADMRPPDDTRTAPPARNGGTNSSQMEKDLQRLPWTQFRSVIESVPKLKADVEAYGPMGWQYVRKTYTTHGWKKNIDKLDDSQKKRLAELIRTAKGSN